MTHIDLTKLSWDERDEIVNPPPAVTDFDRVVESAISRRGFLGGLLVFGSGAAALGGNLLNSTAAIAAESRFAFKPIPIATDGTVHVPEGYSWKPLAKWGQPLFSGVSDLDHATGGTLADASKVFGENTDGMETFLVGDRQLIAINHEYVNPEVNLPKNPEGKPASADDVRKLQSLQGVTVMEIAEGNRRLGHRARQSLQPAHRQQHADDARRPRRRSRPLEDRGRPDRYQGVRHAQQLRLGPDALGHVSDLRRELQRLLRLHRRGLQAAGRLQALRHRGQGAVRL